MNEIISRSKVIELFNPIKGEASVIVVSEYGAMWIKAKNLKVKIFKNTKNKRYKSLKI